jgi:hypothetical protein
MYIMFISTSSASVAEEFGTNAEKSPEDQTFQLLPHTAEAYTRIFSSIFRVFKWIKLWDRP